MGCKLCGSVNVSVEYRGKLRVHLNPDSMTDDDVNVYRCDDCGVIWHEYKMPKDYYTSATYRTLIEGQNDVETHYRRFDYQTLEKLIWTGTDIYRHKTVADIGAGGGCFIDFLIGVAGKTIAIEPNEVFRKAMSQNGHTVYDYVSSALQRDGHSLRGSIDILTSFDVIEHIEDPKQWLRELYELLKPGGMIICGTPTDYPVLRKFRNNLFDKVIFQISHPWIFSKQALQNVFSEAGFRKIQVEQKMHYGIGNFVNWLTNGTAKGDIRFDEFSDTLNVVWKSEMVSRGLGEYLLVKAVK
ncbi:MAG: class I SAM-dependent methyltransferase [Treponema sp.]|nr:class I SAM-dependent methyltransferase [Treponema sp.]